MKNRTWKAAGILGGALVLAAGTGTLVHAAETKEEIENEQSAKSVLETIAWDQQTVAANVNSFVNIRTEASLDGEKTGVLPKGATGQILEEGNEWTKISSGEIEGYVKTELLAFGEEAKKLYEETYGNQGTVTVDSLRIRKEPSLDSAQIGSSRKGSAVKIVDQTGDWYQIDHNGEPGYMFGEYIDINTHTALSVEEYEEQKKEASAVSVSNNELDILAGIIQCEAGGESHTGKLAVGAVIMNRIRSASFPNSISQVVYQRGQFSPVASGKLASVLSQGARSDCYQAAQEVLAGANPIGGCLYFNSGRGKGIQIGNQHFY